MSVYLYEILYEYGNTALGDIFGNGLDFMTDSYEIIGCEND